MMGSLASKAVLRTRLKKLRAQLTYERHQQAAYSLFTTLLPLLKNHENILSFASFSTEIETNPINRHLAKTGQLLLPKVVKSDLKIYRITDLDTQLAPSEWGIMEPISEVCTIVDPKIISLTLVPALGFDKRHHRIGHGQGHYDRFLSNIPHCLTFGIGFREQHFKKFPIDPTDVPMNHVYLF